MAPDEAMYNLRKPEGINLLTPNALLGMAGENKAVDRFAKLSAETPETNG
jgi:hypothetical protein